MGAARRAGEEIGAAVAAHAIARARADGANTAPDNLLPEGPGYYTSRTPADPPGEALGRGWLRPDAQCARLRHRWSGQPLFKRRSAEVREAADARTPQQLALAMHWADGVGTVTPAGHWNVIAADLIRRYGFPESEALRALTLSNIAALGWGP